jgi:hypothetical protein
MISFGSVFLEIVIGHVRQLPRPGAEIFTDDFAISCGGAVTSASAAARAGAVARAGARGRLVRPVGRGSRLPGRRGPLHPGRASTCPRHRGCRGTTVVLNFDAE